MTKVWKITSYHLGDQEIFRALWWSDDFLHSGWAGPERYSPDDALRDGESSGMRPWLLPQTRVLAKEV
jgi:hypothetical protein